jgi:hypothetical protein
LHEAQSVFSITDQKVCLSNNMRMMLQGFATHHGQINYDARMIDRWRASAAASLEGGGGL